MPINRTALVVVGGYTENGATDSVEVLDLQSRRSESGTPLPRARYGHSCLLMEWQGRDGVLVSGGALTGRDVVFYDIQKQR